MPANRWRQHVIGDDLFIYPFILMERAKRQPALDEFLRSGEDPKKSE